MVKNSVTMKPMSRTDNVIDLARWALGSYSAIARVCQVTPATVNKWKRQGRLPRTEYTGETCYASQIVLASNGKLEKKTLLPLGGVL